MKLQVWPNLRTLNVPPLPYRKLGAFGGEGAKGRSLLAAEVYNINTSGPSANLTFGLVPACS